MASYLQQHQIIRPTSSNGLYGGGGDNMNGSGHYGNGSPSSFHHNNSNGAYYAPPSPHGVGGGGGGGYYPNTNTNHNVSARQNFYANQQLQMQLMSSYQKPPTLREWFASVDTDRSGSIDAHELSRALQKGRINITTSGAAKLIALFDSNGSGRISYEEFKAMHPFLDSMTKGFKKRDLSGDGFLSIDEVNAALMESGHRVSSGCLQTLMLKFDSHRRGKLSFDDYVTLSIFIASVRNTFANFDQRGAGQVAMDFNQFITACIIVK